MQTDLAEQVIQAAIEVHTVLGGPGLVESVYEAALCYELNLRKIVFQRQVPLPILYKGHSIRRPFFVDVVVENQLIIEVKALGIDNPYYLAQLFTHVHLMKMPKGLLINFGKETLQDGIACIANERLYIERNAKIGL
jgi:GxxExxY protein